MCASFAFRVRTSRARGLTPPEYAATPPITVSSKCRHAGMPGQCSRFINRYKVKMTSRWRAADVPDDGTLVGVPLPERVRREVQRIMEAAAQRLLIEDLELDAAPSAAPRVDRRRANDRTNERTTLIEAESTSLPLLDGTVPSRHRRRRA